MPLEKRLVSMLTALLEAETEAKGIIEKAEREAKGSRDQTKLEVQKILEEAKAQEELEMQQALQKARDQAELVRNAILNLAKKEAENWEDLFQRNRDKAINFVIELAIKI